MITFSRRSLFLMLLLFPFFATAQEAVKKDDKKPEEKKAHPYDKNKVADPKSLHDYFTNQLVETAKNIGARGTYLVAQEKSQDWKLPTIDAATAPLTHLFKSGNAQMDNRSLIERMLLRAAKCESGAIMSDEGETMATFAKSSLGIENLITNEKAIAALENPKLAGRVLGVVDKNINQVLSHYSPERLATYFPYEVEDGKDGALRKIITPEQFTDCVHICFLKAAKQFAEDKGAIVIDPAKYKPEYKGAFAAEDPQVAKKSAKETRKKSPIKTTK